MTRRSRVPCTPQAALVTDRAAADVAIDGQPNGWPVEWTCVGFAIVTFITLSKLGSVASPYFIGSCTALSGMCTPGECSCAAPLRRRELVTQDSQRCFQCIAEFCPMVADGDEQCMVGDCECEDPTWPRKDVGDGITPCWQCPRPTVNWTLRMGGSTDGACIAGAEAGQLERAVAIEPTHARIDSQHAKLLNESVYVGQRLKRTDSHAECIVFGYNGARITVKQAPHTCLAWNSFGDYWGLKACDAHDPSMQFQRQDWRHKDGSQEAMEQVGDVYCAARASGSEACVEVFEHICTVEEDRCSTENCRCEDPSWIRQELLTLNGTRCFSCAPPVVRCTTDQSSCTLGPCQCGDSEFIPVPVLASAGYSSADADITQCFRCEQRGPAQHAAGDWSMETWRDELPLVALVVFLCICLSIFLCHHCCHTKQPGDLCDSPAWVTFGAGLVSRVPRGTSIDTRRKSSERWTDYMASFLEGGNLFWQQLWGMVSRILDVLDATLEPCYCIIDVPWDFVIMLHERLVVAVSRACVFFKLPQFAGSSDVLCGDIKSATRKKMIQKGVLYRPTTQERSKPIKVDFGMEERNHKLATKPYGNSSAADEDVSTCMWDHKAAEDTDSVLPSPPKTGVDRTNLVPQSRGNRKIERRKQRVETAVPSTSPVVSKETTPAEKVRTDQGEPITRKAKPSHKKESNDHRSPKTTPEEIPADEGHAVPSDPVSGDPSGNRCDQQYLPPLSPRLTSVSSSLKIENELTPDGAREREWSRTSTQTPGNTDESTSLCRERIAAEVINMASTLSESGLSPEPPATTRLLPQAVQDDDHESETVSQKFPRQRAEMCTESTSISTLSLAQTCLSKEDTTGSKKEKHAAIHRATRKLSDKSNDDTHASTKGTPSIKPREDSNVETSFKDDLPPLLEKPPGLAPLLEQPPGLLEMPPGLQDSLMTCAQCSEEETRSSSNLPEVSLKKCDGFEDRSSRRGITISQLHLDLRRRDALKEKCIAAGPNESLDPTTAYDSPEVSGFAPSDVVSADGDVIKRPASFISKKSHLHTHLGTCSQVSENNTKSEYIDLAQPLKVAIDFSVFGGSDAPEFVPLSREALRDIGSLKAGGQSDQKGRFSPVASTGQAERTVGGVQSDIANFGLPTEFGELSRFAPCGEMVTTVILMGIPEDHSQQSFKETMDLWGLAGTYNFLFMPAEPSDGMLNHALINFIDAGFVLLLQWLLAEAQFPGTPVPAWIQGVEACLEFWGRDYGVLAGGDMPIVVTQPTPSIWAVNTTNELLSPQCREQCRKTKMCAFHKVGRCTRGSECPFAHNEDELHPVPDLMHTKLCSNYFCGKCEDMNCRYAHGSHELRLNNMSSAEGTGDFITGDFISHLLRSWCLDPSLWAMCADGAAWWPMPLQVDEEAEVSEDEIASEDDAGSDEDEQKEDLDDTGSDDEAEQEKEVAACPCGIAFLPQAAFCYSCGAARPQV